MIRRKPDFHEKFTIDQKTPPPTPSFTAWLAMLFVLVVLVTPGPLIDTIKSLLSLPVMPAGESGFPIDKVVHWAMFAVCGFLNARAWAGRYKLVVIVLVLLGFAAATEFLQTVVPGRSGDIADFLADAVGVVMGAWWFCRRGKKR